MVIEHLVIFGSPKDRPANINQNLETLSIFTGPYTQSIRFYPNSIFCSSLMKMVVNFAKSSGGLNRNQLEHSIKRNFGGFDPDDFNPLETFLKRCPSINSLKRVDGDPPTDAIGLIKSSLSGKVTALEG